MSVRLEKSRVPNLYRAENGAYYLRAMVNGKAVKKLLKSEDGNSVKNFAVAKIVLIDELGKLGHGKDECPALWEKVCDDYLSEYCSRPEISRHTVASKTQEVNFAKEAFRGDMINKITASDIKAWWERFCDEKRRDGRERSSRTKNRVQDTVQAIFQYGIQSGLLANAPKSEIKRLHIPKTLKKLSPIQEFKEIIQSMRDAYKRLKNIKEDDFTCHSADMVEFMAYSGARIAEVRLVLREDIQKDGVIIHGVKRSDDRFIPFSKGLKVICEKLIAFHESNKRGDHERVFLIETPRKAFDRATERVGAPHCTMHGLRHFFITSCVEAGVLPATIAKWVGHKDGGLLIARTYTHIRDDHGRAEAAKLDF